MNDLKLIKDKYGENMMHLCRRLFPTLLEKEGLLFNLLEKNFAYSKFLYDDIIENSAISKFKNFIYSLVDEEKKEIIVTKTPQELLNEVDYILYECKTEEDIESFRKYYEENEELCTFDDNRLDDCYVFFAVKKNVDEIKREDFTKPNRQDKYGTSVISIQFSRGNTNTLSIKNRYNHTVNNPDATYSNNLENIIPGLTKSFEKYYNLNINQNDSKEFELIDYVKANDGKLYKYNYEIGNVYYGPDNTVINNFTVEERFKQKEKYIVMDYFILDLENKKILKDSTWINEHDFCNTLKNIEKIEINKEKNTKNKEIILTTNNNKITIVIDKYNRMISYKNENITYIGNDFLRKNKYLKELILPSVLEIGNDLLCNNKVLNIIELPNVEYIGEGFLFENECLTEISLPMLKMVKDYFLYENIILGKIDTLKLEKIGNAFLKSNKNLKSICLPNTIYIGNSFLLYNRNLKSIYLPNVEKICNHFLQCNTSLISIDLPKVEFIGDYFLKENKIIENLSIPKVKKIGSYFLYDNQILNSINLPNVNEISNYFLYSNNKITTIDFPKLTITDAFFLYKNEIIEYVNLPKLEEAGYNFLGNNLKLKTLNLPEVKIINDGFLHCNEILEEFIADKLVKVAEGFLANNNSLKYLSLPNLEECYCSFLLFNNSIIILNIPKLKLVHDKQFMPYNTTLKELYADNLEIKDDFFESNPLFCKEKVLQLKKTL